MQTLKKLGCKFSLDDFGSGLSSFTYLKNLPVDYLKIDGQFIRNVVDDTVDESMVRAISEVGHAMGICPGLLHRQARVGAEFRTLECRAGHAGLSRYCVATLPSTIKPSEIVPSFGHSCFSRDAGLQPSHYRPR